KSASRLSYENLRRSAERRSCPFKNRIDDGNACDAGIAADGAIPWHRIGDPKTPRGCRYRRIDLGDPPHNVRVAGRLFPVRRQGTCILATLVACNIETKTSRAVIRPPLQFCRTKML